MDLTVSGAHEVIFDGAEAGGAGTVSGGLGTILSGGSALAKALKPVAGYAMRDADNTKYAMTPESEPNSGDAPPPYLMSSEDAYEAHIRGR